MNKKIEYVSLFFRIIFQIIFLTLPVVIIIGWINIPESLHLFDGAINIRIIPEEYSSAIVHLLSVEERLLGFAVSLIPLSIDLLILYFLIKLFHLYEAGEVFSIQNVNYIRNIGYSLLLRQLLSPVYEFLMGFVLTSHNPAGLRFASITFDQTNFGILLTALLVILISWIMAEGCRLREEQQLTI